MSALDAGQAYELVVQGPVGPVLEHVLRPCTVHRTEFATVLRGERLGVSVAELVRCLDEHGWVVSRVALIG